MVKAHSGKIYLKERREEVREEETSPRQSQSIGLRIRLRELSRVAATAEDSGIKSLRNTAFRGISRDAKVSQVKVYCRHKETF